MHLLFVCPPVSGKCIRACLRFILI
ncbi:hypothetical protein J2Z49_000288 [Desulfofundulus luciae]|uniref:Uncharacterized protein n=1 Tax=Desulfofundulus luciae TaxID=74702 RepID=A0ABU0AXJ7_9FIRM|nr:hypothetical protein [Desulfofundulus luciae]